jgi:hypothetical protein
LDGLVNGIGHCDFWLLFFEKRKKYKGGLFVLNFSVPLKFKSEENRPGKETLWRRAILHAHNTPMVLRRLAPSSASGKCPASEGNVSCRGLTAPSVTFPIAGHFTIAGTLGAINGTNEI